MIYLISQMLVALAVAILLGAAIGWLIHRGSHAQDVKQMKQELARQRAQLAQALSEVDLVAADYREMETRSHDQIATLQAENQNIAELTNNLERAQLMVSQNMKKHESRERDLINENQKLLAELEPFRQKDRLQTQREAAVKQELGGDSTVASSKTADTSQKANTDSAPASKSRPSREDATQQQMDLTQHLPFEDSEASIVSNAESTAAVPGTELAAAEEDPFDDVMEIGDELQLDLDHTDPVTHSEKLRQTWASATSAKARTPMVDLSDDESLEDESLEDESLKDESLEDESLKDASLQDESMEDASLQDESMKDASLQDGTAEIRTDQSSAADIGTDGSTDDATLFQPVDQRDDLQQIFGIGPMTEKALNELGITSYSQLADLQQHDIQRIANALDIGATRIERDNWVGNARRQLEDVLEQL